MGRSCLVSGNHAVPADSLAVYTRGSTVTYRRRQLIPIARLRSTGPLGLCAAPFAGGEYAPAAMLTLASVSITW